MKKLPTFKSLQVEFADLAGTAWYHDGIHYCLENGLMGGIGGGLFDPNGTTTRAMIVTILYRMDGSPASEQNNMFTDVQESAYYYDAVLWAYANGITGGYGNGLFGPNDAITREQMVTMLLRYATYKDLDVSAGEETNSHSSLTTAQRHSSRKPISQSKQD